jgi:uncharacterized membrane protein
MISVSRDITIRRPVEQVFAFATNPENFPQWQSEIVQSKIITEGPLRVGSQFTEVVKVMGRPNDTVCEITQYEEPRLMSFESKSSKAIEYGGRLAFDAVDGATKVNLTGTANLKGLWRLVQPFFAGELKRGVADELNKLKSVLEEQT